MQELVDFTPTTVFTSFITFFTTVFFFFLRDQGIFLSLTIHFVLISCLELIEIIILFTGLNTWTRRSTLMLRQQLTLCSSTQTVDETFLSV